MKSSILTKFLKAIIMLWMPTPETSNGSLHAQKMGDEVIGPKEYKAVRFEPQAVLDSLAVLRHKDTELEEFKKHADRIFRMVGDELAKDLPKKTVHIPTQVDGAVHTQEISDSSGVLLLGILRSGYPAAIGIQEAMPDATVGLIDVKRDHETAIPSLKYNGIEGLDLSGFNEIIIPDPMLATGGSAEMAIEELVKLGARIDQIHLVSLVSAPEGIKRLNEIYPELRITVNAVDQGLNSKKYIVPGLGDFGDRYYGKVGPASFYDPINKITLPYVNGEIIPPDKKPAAKPLF